MMMYPIAMSVISVMEHQNHNGNSKLCSYVNAGHSLCVQFGGIATIIGTPPMLLMLVTTSRYGQELDFSNGFVVCTDNSIITGSALLGYGQGLVSNHILASPGAAAYVAAEKQALGKPGKSEKECWLYLHFTALLWIFRSLINDIQSVVKLDDTIIAILAITLLLCLQKKGHVFVGLVRYIQNGMGHFAPLVGVLHWLMAWKIRVSFKNGQLAGIVWPQYHIATFIGYCILIVHWRIHEQHRSSHCFAPLVSAMADSLHLNPVLLGIPMTLAASCAGMMLHGYTAQCHRFCKWSHQI